MVMDNHFEHKEEIKNEIKKEIKEETKTKDDEFLTEDEKKNNIIDRLYINSKFQNIVSLYNFNEFTQENKLILTRIYKQLSNTNTHIVDNNKFIESQITKNVSDIVGYNQNIDYKLKKNIQSINELLNKHNSFNYKFYIMDSVLKVCLFYVFYTFMLNNNTCNI
jgi:hypothetical protein